MTSIVECVVQANNILGEVPLWCSRTQRIWWIDIYAPALHSYDPASHAHTSIPLPGKIVGSFALRRSGGMVIARNDGFFSFDPESGASSLLACPEPDKPEHRLNDGKCDRRGRFFAGGMDDKEELGICGLWRLDPDLSVTKVDDGIICSNGPCWSPDDKIFYFADTFKREIWAYDYDLDNGSISNRRIFTSLVDEPGFADGSTVDADGYLWNAQVIGGELIRYTPEGKVDLRLTMPVKNITSVMFGGPNLDEIYVTSMARVQHPAQHDHFAAEVKPQFTAGGLFRIKGLGIRGVAEPRFAG